MIKISETQSRFGLSTAAGLLAVILAVMGIVFGNEPAIDPDLSSIREYIWSQKITNDFLVKKLVAGDASFRIAGFYFSDKCVLKTEKNRFFKCNDGRKLNDLTWIRKEFHDLKVPLIIFSSNAKESLMAASMMMYYGYDAHMLEDGYLGFKKEYLTPVIIPPGASVAERKRLEKKALLYKFLTYDDENIGKKAVIMKAPAKPGGPGKKINHSSEGEGC